MTNAYADNALHVRLQDGSFVPMALGNALGNTGWLGDVLAARNGYLWCIMPRGQGLLVYDTNNTPGDTQDYDWRILTSDPKWGFLRVGKTYVRPLLGMTQGSPLVPAMCDTVASYVE